MRQAANTTQLTLSAAALACAATLSACGHREVPEQLAPDQSPQLTTQTQPSTAHPQLAPPTPAAELLAPSSAVVAPVAATRELAIQSMARPSTLATSKVRMPLPQGPQINRDRYATLDSNPVKRTSDDPVSTFSLDVDTGSYAVVRRHIQQGTLPPAAAVRVEELINYFDYSYPSAGDTEHPFAFSSELASSPWHPNRQLLKINIAAWRQPMQHLPPSNLVFLVDVSGSMQSADKLPLLKASLKLLLRQMRPQDTVSLVTYAGQSAVVLEPTSAEQQRKISDAIDALGAGGGTHGAAGLKDAYQLAHEHRLANGINRVILATDGDFNVGMSDTQSLLDYIAQQRQSGISLSTLGFGQGNYNDHLMEQLADQGNGNHAYIDTLFEAQKVLNQNVGATLLTVAKDAKIQVEFNPATISEYRLIGYENRQLHEQDFHNDKVDAGDIGAGHTLTALYEIALRNSGGERLPARRYTAKQTAETSTHEGELAWVKMRYKARGSDQSTLLEHKIQAAQQAKASSDLQFASAVAAWAEWLRQSANDDALNIEQILRLARAGKGADRHGYRAQFIQLVELSAALR